MKTCTSCGEDRNPDDARFCAGCGTPLASESSGPAAESASVDAAAQMMSVAVESSDPGPASTSAPEPNPAPAPTPTPEPEFAPVAETAVDRYEEPAWAQPPVPAPPVESRVAPNQEARYWAIAAHATALIGGFMGGIPAFLGPLVVWLIRKDDDAWSAGHGRDALNFNLSVLAYGIGLGLLAIVTLGIGLLIAIPGWIFLALGWFALTIVGTIKAANDQRFKYPLTIRFVK